MTKIGKNIYILVRDLSWINIRVFCSFHKSDRSDIAANVVDIHLCVNIMLS